MKAVPFAQNNAIEASVFTVKLSRPADAQAEARLHAALDQAKKLPGRSRTQTLEIHLSNNPHQPAPPTSANLKRFEVKPDGSVRYGMQLNGDVLFVACHDYTRYSEVWPQIREFLHLGLEAVGADYELVEVTHQVVDRFTYTAPQGVDPQSVYRMDELFRLDTPYLTPKAWNSGLLWHVHQGWFEPIQVGRQYLHQLNISNNELSPGQQFATIIDHRELVRMHIGAPIKKGDAEQLDVLYRTLHERNVRLVQELLVEEKLDAIHMGRPA